MKDVLGIELTPEIIALLSSPKQPAEVSRSSVACPRCLGAGFRHDSSSKHDKKASDKCKHCTSCKGKNILIQLATVWDQLWERSRAHLVSRGDLYMPPRKGSTTYLKSFDAFSAKIAQLAKVSELKTSKECEGPKWHLHC